MLIRSLVEATDTQRKVEEVYRATKEREQKEHRPFGDILQEEVMKMNKREKLKRMEVRQGMNSLYELTVQSYRSPLEQGFMPKEKATEDTDQSNPR